VINNQTIISAETVHATEWFLRDSIGDVIASKDHAVYRSSEFTQYCGGNGLEIRLPYTRSFDEWINLYRTYFSTETYPHIMFSFPPNESSEALIVEASSNNFQIGRNCYMVRTSLPEHIDLPADLEVTEIKTIKDWEQYRKFEYNEAIRHPWCSSEKDSDPLFERMRAATESAAIRWFALRRRGYPRMLSKLGIFFHNKVARLQEVVTVADERGKGFATALIDHISLYALQNPAICALTVCAEESGPNRQMYKRMGFERVGDAIDMLLPPTSWE